MTNPLPEGNAGRAPRVDWLERCGCFGAAVLVLFFQVNATVAWIGLSLACLAFLGRLPHRLALLVRDPTTYLLLAVIGHVAVSAGMGAAEFPDTAPEQWQSLKLWCESLLFMPVAFFLGRDALGLQRVCLLFATGVLLRILTHLHGVHWFSGERVGFGLNPIATALYSGIAGLGLLTLAPRLLEHLGKPAWLKPVIYVTAPAALLTFLEALLLSQARAAWLAATLTFPATLAARYWHGLRALRWRSRKTLAGLALIAAAIGMLGAMNAGIVKQRVLARPEAVEQVVRGGKAEDAEASIGYRLLLWRVGLDSWLERPIIGWGAGSSERLIQQSDIAMLMRKPGQALFSHLHNTYLEILVRFGLFGAALFGALAILLIAGPWRSYRAGALPRDMFCLLLGVWGMTAIWAFFDFRLFHYEWRNFCILLGAVSYSQTLQLRRS